MATLYTKSHSQCESFNAFYGSLSSAEVASFQSYDTFPCIDSEE